MSCLCCCWRRNSEEAKQDENGNQPGDHELVFKVPTEEIENPRASSMRDDNSIGYRSSLHKLPEVRVIIDSYHDSAISPGPIAAASTMKARAPVAIMEDCADHQLSTVAVEPRIVNASTADANITNICINESKTDNAATVVVNAPSYKPKKSNPTCITAQAPKKCIKIQKRSKSADNGDEEFDRQLEGQLANRVNGDISIGSETGSTHYFEDLMLHSAGPDDMAALKKELHRNDSFDKEFKENAAGHSMHKSDYVLYDKKESVSQANDLMLIGLCKQREDLLSSISEIIPKVVQRINSERAQHSSNDIYILPELNEFATVLWQDRAHIRDGFVVVPRGVFFPRSGAPDKRYGCLVYYTNRAAYPQTIPDAMVNFWIHNGEPARNIQEVFVGNLPGALPGASLIKVSDFPEAKTEDCYVRQDSKMGRAFQKYRENFRSQLLAAQCKAMGVHIDMVRTGSHRNLICVAVIFDYVANLRGREMPSPFI